MTSHQTTDEATICNGVNVSQMFETIEAIKQNAEIASFRFRARGRWVDGAHNQTTIDDFDGACATHRRTTPIVFDKDEPPVLLGRDQGANPVEYVLAGLAGCLTTSLVYHASARGIRIDEVETSFEGDLDLRGFLGLDENVRTGYQQIRIKIAVKGDASDEQLRELVELAEKRSPVYDVVPNRVPVTVSFVKQV